MIAEYFWAAMIIPLNNACVWASRYYRAFLMSHARYFEVKIRRYVYEAFFNSV